MLGFIIDDAIGATDRLLCQVADTLQARGMKLAGAVQENLGGDAVTRCDMVLRVLGTDAVFTISQSLGPCATGCRLDPGALERAVGLVQATLNDPADVLIVNKFGKQEIDGRGFRPVIAEALSRGIPVLTATGGGQRDAFVGFSGDMAQQIEATPEAILSWLHAQPSLVEAP